MAVWQYDFILIPRDELISQAGILPTELSIDQVNRFKFWKVRQPKAVYADRFDSWSQEIKSWTPNLRLWGKEDSNRIDVAFSNEKIHEIEFRIEVRSINVRFLQLMVDFARTENCVLLSMHSLCVIEPLRERVLNYLTQSNGVNEVWDWLHDIPKVSKTNVPGCLFLSHT